MKSRAIVIVIIVMIFMLSGQLFCDGVAPEGSGSSEDPYEISSLDNLLWVSTNNGSWLNSNYFIQTADIDASETSTWNDGAGFSPIGTNSHPFYGEYDGQSHYISGLYINRNIDYLGLFGKRWTLGGISNVNLIDITIIGDDLDYCGGVCGYSRSPIENCFCSGSITVTSGNCIGGIAGYIIGANASLSNCSSSCDVNGYYQVGGLVGSALDSTILNCNSSCNVTGIGTGAGGFHQQIGGLIGFDDGSNIYGCYSRSTVEGYQYIGGLCGKTENTDITNCYSRSTVEGSYRVGGFCSETFYTNITNCYSSGTVSGISTVGGFIPTFHSGCAVEYCYWNTTIAGCVNTHINGLTGLSTEQMQDQLSYTNWDFSTIWDIDCYNNDRFPYLRVEDNPEAIDQTITISQDDQSLIQFNDVNTEIQFTTTHNAVELEVVMVNMAPDIDAGLPENYIITSQSFWHITPDAEPGGNYNITYDLTGVDGIEYFDYLKILRRDNDGSPWQDVESDPINAVVIYDQEENKITVQGLSSFSEFVPAINEDDPLPVTLSSFTAVYNNSQPVLQWITQSEKENSGWNIYRNSSEDLNGSLKLNLALIPGAGTTTEVCNYSYTDEYEIEEGGSYYYWLESISNNGANETFGPVTLAIPEEGEDETPETPLSFELHQNYPNPFNPLTTIEYEIAMESEVEIKIYNARGELVKTLVSANQPAGSYQATWNGTDDKEKEVSSGVYFYKLITDYFVETRSMMLLK